MDLPLWLTLALRLLNAAANAPASPAVSPPDDATNDPVSDVPPPLEGPDNAELRSRFWLASTFRNRPPPIPPLAEMDLSRSACVPAALGTDGPDEVVSRIGGAGGALGTPEE